MSSGPRPRASTSGTYTELQPRSCRWIESSKSSVSELVGNPPTLSNASRRNSTLVPQQKTASSPSLPRAIAPKNSACCAHDAAAMRLPSVLA